MKPEDILKEEFGKRMQGAITLMNAAPNFSCCLIALMTTDNMLKDLMESTAEAIKEGLSVRTN